MTKRKNEVLMVRLDEGSAGDIAKMIEKEVSCGNTMNLQTENGGFDFLRHGLFCKAMFAAAELDDSQSDQQCVVMGGDVDKCPRFGTLPNGQSTGEDERIAQVLMLQQYVDKHLNYHSRGNFHQFTGTKE